MAIKELLEEFNKLSPEERAQLKDLFGGNNEEKQKKEDSVREKHGPENVKSSRVYFFEQRGRIEVEEVKRDGDKITKYATELPPRVIATTEREASKLFWKRRNKFSYLGTSNGAAWKKARLEGKRVAEAQALEFEAMKAKRDMTPPRNFQKTVFAGKNAVTASRGIELEWDEGIKQLKQ